MKTGTELSSILVLTVSLTVIGCGTVVYPSSPSPTTPALAPNGNWLLTGNRSLGKFPILSFALFVDGNQITAAGDVEVNCIGSQLALGEEDVGLSGQDSPNGAFQLNQQLAGNFPISITGVVPAQYANSWSGTYSLGSSPGCSVNQVAPFTATVLPSLSGIYSGTLNASGRLTHTAQVGVTSTFMQGAATSVVLGNGSTVHYLPLSAAIRFSGLQCFTNGASLTGFQNSIEGDYFQLYVSMDDGSQIIFSGVYSDPTGSSLNVSVNVNGGNCDHYMYDGALSH